MSLLSLPMKNPDIIVTEGRSMIATDNETEQLEGEITRLLEQPTFDRTEIWAKLRSLASMRYSAIDEKYCISLQLRADFEQAEGNNVSFAELANRTVKEIRLGENGSVRLVLMNGQILEEGEAKDDS